MPLFKGTCTSAPLCLPRKPCATFRPFDSLGAGRGSIEAFRSGSSIHSLALTTAITHRAGSRGGSYIYISPPELWPFCLPTDSSYRKRCQLMTFRKFHITPNNSEAFYRNSSIGTEGSCGCFARQRGREGETDAEDYNLSLTSLCFHVISLNSGWYTERHIILIVFMIEALGFIVG